MNSFINYLNGLHNYSAQNQNSYGEKNVESEYFEKTFVEVSVCKLIHNKVENEKPHMIILTGHAGDGKTSIMYRVLSKYNVEPGFKEPQKEITLNSGRKCICIKDFSELQEEKRTDLFHSLIESIRNGDYVFMVANTGPLINTFGSLFDDVNTSEKAKMMLINAMDLNDGAITSIMGIDVSVINVAAVDNTSFATKYIDKLIQDECWEECKNCPKKQFCHINLNKMLIVENKTQVYDFIEKYYIWLTEYGTRLTIRSMVEQLTFMITAGDNCDNVEPDKVHKKILSNNFFGYYGTILDPSASNILAVRTAQESNLWSKRIRSDEELHIRRNYGSIFGKTIESLICDTEPYMKRSANWDEELRRMYMFFNIVDSESKEHDYEDIFSKQFNSYIKVRNGEKPTKAQKNLVLDALRMMNLGIITNTNNDIPITMSTESGIQQSVQLIVGFLNNSDIELLCELDSELNSGKHNLALKFKGSQKLYLSLPMMDYFEDLKNGIISTNIDPQLSHGIETLKAMLLNVSDDDSDSIELIIMKNSGPDKHILSIENDIMSLIM